jgi:hypothetical protein
VTIQGSASSVRTVGCVCTPPDGPFVPPTQSRRGVRVRDPTPVGSGPSPVGWLGYDFVAPAVSPL